jgi:hypothetical protein
MTRGILVLVYIKGPGREMKQKIPRAETQNNNHYWPKTKSQNGVKPQ